jgi:hypothetical protein
MVAASSTQVDVGRNAGGTHAGRTPGIYTHGTLAVLAVSDKAVLTAYLTELLKRMPARCQAMIDANGEHTRY